MDGDNAKKVSSVLPPSLGPTKKEENNDNNNDGEHDDNGEEDDEYIESKWASKQNIISWLGLDLATVVSCAVNDGRRLDFVIPADLRP
jgi:hypothetical protein